MTVLTLLLAATLSAGNAEFETAATCGAYEIVRGRERARLVAEGPEKGALARAMLAKPSDFAHAAEAKRAAWTVYRSLVETAYAAFCRRAGARLGLSNPVAADLAEADFAQARKSFEVVYAAERAAACAEQAATLVGVVRPSELEFETQPEDTLKREMCAKVAAQQKTVVFEENLGYISTKIVEPVLDSARRERKRQAEYLRRVRSEAAAPAALTADLAGKLVLNVRDRQAADGDLACAWGVFPSVTNVTLKQVVHRRVMDRLAVRVADVPFDVSSNLVAEAIASDRSRHRSAVESRGLFRRRWAVELCLPVVLDLRDEAPAAQRRELGDYLSANLSDERVVKAVNRRLDEDLLPRLDAIRRQLAAAEFIRTWPSLADRTWFPCAELADATSARSDYAAAVRGWRSLVGIGLETDECALEEAVSRADKGVADAFELSRGAIAAQLSLVDEAHPVVLAKAKMRKDSFWSRTPDFAAIVSMLTDAVEKRWAETKCATLWPKGDLPPNANEQHDALFPSVRKRIEMIASTIVSEMERPESDASSDDTQLSAYSIIVSREGDRVTVRLDRGGERVFERSPRAKMGDFRQALREVGDKLGRDILRLE